MHSHSLNWICRPVCGLAISMAPVSVCMRGMSRSSFKPYSILFSRKSEISSCDWQNTKDFPPDAFMKSWNAAFSFVFSFGIIANRKDYSKSGGTRRFPKGDAPNRRRKRSESPLVGRWGKAPYPKMLSYLFLEMFGLSLTAPFCCFLAVYRLQ